MFSISDNEFDVINYLVRDFSTPYTMRSIALSLKQSPAGVFSILKKLEKNNIVKSQKLGTGLFYSMNLENKVSMHLAAVMLVIGEKKKLDLSKVESQLQAAMFDGKNLLLITESLNIDALKLKEVNVISKTRFEVEDSLRKKDKAMLSIMKNGLVLKGEDSIVEIIKNAMPRY